jgi:hypothetical protein
MKLITQSVANNIAAHVIEAWRYSAPNAGAAEAVIREGLKAFYDDVEQKGGSTTIVDVQVGTSALDIKGRQVLTIYSSTPKKTKKSVEFQSIKVDNGIHVKIPLWVATPVRRPKTDHNDFKNDAEKVMLDQINEYTTYADVKTKAANCTSLSSVILLYGEGNGYKSIFLTEQDFSAPIPATYSTKVNKDNKPKGYEAFDADGNLLYKFSPYSKGSDNFNKAFKIDTKGFLFVWKPDPMPSFTEEEANAKWAQDGNYAVEVAQKS